MSANPPRTSPPRPFWLVIIGIVVLWSALGSLVSRIQFARTLENLNVETALEAWRDGNWLKPTLEGQSRTKKPPLTAWITALAISPQTVRDCGNADSATRMRAFSALAWECRWPALLQASLTLLAIYLFGAVAADASIGAAASLLAASAYLFLRYAQVAQTDVTLMLCVTLANALLALAVLRERWWVGMVGGGVALGLAFLAKGPVALVQVAVPWALWKLLADRKRRWPIGPILAGVLVFAVVALPWYLVLFLQDPQRQWSIWFKEVTGTDAPDRGEAFFYYLIYLLEFMPALFFAIPATVNAFKDQFTEHRRNRLLMLCLIVTPIVVMSCFKDKKDRYLLPMIGPIAVLAAIGWREMVAAASQELTARTMTAIYWIVLALLPISLAICGVVGWPSALRGSDGYPWISWPIASGAVLLSILIVLAAVRSRRDFAPLFTLLLMALLMHLITFGYYLRSAAGQSKMLPLAQRIWREYPDAGLFTTMPFGQRASEDLSIYMNRTTGWITADQMRAMKPRSRPVLVLMRQKLSMPAVKLPLPWRQFMSFPKETGEVWQAVVLPAAGPSTQKNH